MIVLTEPAQALLLKLIAATDLLDPVIVLMSPKQSDGPDCHWGVILTERLELPGRQFEHVRGLSFCVDEEATSVALSIDAFEGQFDIAELRNH